ncbi:FAD-dependent pyridine nucleotide-disulfide oxidoreductase [Deinococcus phoenicis]|uniref:Ferredoxin--NADP reductase n=1 Tax=Deinococcus phoenicis TaxID=1476583 RepID=A0A016QQ22_9DEIO|nr:NAD(P)/FAD-dependent oxidoreductase [Deinococcus phoenicis]EYB67884.1 FAD-dependent pyridine nucleotide-disulfide oxidoreductase [Deinococcus phoenicis]
MPTEQPPRPALPRTDILVIGGGPAGLHAAFYAAWRGLKVRVLEARGEVGGQLMALYPDKVIYDAPGVPQVRAGKLVEALSAQLEPLDVDVRTGEVARTLEPDGAGGWVIGTGGHRHAAGAVILAAGMGALLPREVRVSGAETHPDVRTDLPDPAGLAGKQVLVVGSVPQATRAALELADAGAAVTLTHRRAGFRGDPQTLARLEAARSEGRVRVLAPAVLTHLTPEAAELSVGGETVRVPAETVLVLNGYLPDLSPLLGWPLTWDGEYVPDGPGGQTPLPGVYVVGDLAQSGGDFKLLSLAFAQAALAANHAAHHVRPELKVRPGHSSERGGYPAAGVNAQGQG